MHHELTHAGRWTIAVAVAGILAFHLTMTATYLSPPNLLKLQLGDLAGRYMDPLFFQNWQLFSPEPGISSIKLAIRCERTDGGWTGWQDPIEDLFARHYRWRVAGYGKLMYIYRDLGISLKRAIRDRQLACLEDARSAPDGDTARCSAAVQAESTLGSPPFELATRWARRECSVRGGALGGGVQLKILEFFPLQFSERHRDDRIRWSEVQEIVLPSEAGDRHDRRAS